MSDERSQKKWGQATTDWELRREDDVLDLGAEVMLPDFAIEHSNGRRVIFEIVVGFWTPEYLKEAMKYGLPTAIISLLQCLNG